jgi:hypothetical protein
LEKQWERVSFAELMLIELVVLTKASVASFSISKSFVKAFSQVDLIVSGTKDISGRAMFNVSWLFTVPILLMIWFAKATVALTRLTSSSFLSLSRLSFLPRF